MQVVNPFLPSGGKHRQDRPRPGGMDGQRVDYVRWYPPDTPFGWGQGFTHPFTNVPAINGGRWINEFLPDFQWEVPAGVPLLGYLWPSIGATDMTFQKQLGGTPRPTASLPVATAMDGYFKALHNAPPAPLSNLAGGFARS